MPDHSAPEVEAGSLARPVRAGWTLLLASIGAFVASLDVVVVSTALPTLRADLHASLSDLEWTINAYNLAFASLLLTGAALGDRFGRRRMYVTGLGLFTAAEIVAAVVALAGVVAAGMAPPGRTPAERREEASAPILPRIAPGTPTARREDGSACPAA